MASRRPPPDLEHGLAAGGGGAPSADNPSTGDRDPRNRGLDPLDLVEAAIERFELAWHADAEPEIAAFLDGLDSTIRQQALIELVKVDLEYRLKLGRPARLEDYFPRWPELRDIPDIVLELAASECLARAHFADCPGQDELRERFGDLADQIDLEAIEAEVASDRAARGGGAATATSDTTARRERAAPPVFLPQMAGQFFGRYEIRERLGDGGEASVYRAFDMRLQRDVALKFPRYSDAKVIDRFTREPETASAVEDRHICRIYDAGAINGVHFIAMQFVAGRTLQQVVEDEGPFDAREAAALLCKSATALAKVHGAGIVHRDIKPSNIMMDEQGEPVLMDFGLAKPAEAATGLTTTGSFLGTLAYMAPEQARGEPANASSDIYSLGVVLFQTLTGRVPFSEAPAECIAEKQKPPVPAPVDIRPSLDAEIDGICRKAMAISPGDRYQSVADLADALERYVDGRPQAIALPHRRTRLRRWGVGAVFTMAMLAAVFAMSRTRERNSNEFPAITEPPAGSVDRWIETPRLDGGLNNGVSALLPASDGRRLFIAHVQHTGENIGSPVRTIDIRTGKDLAEPIAFPVRHIHNAFALTSRQRLYVTNFYYSYITRIELDAGNRLTPVPFVESASDRPWWDTQMVCTPDGKKLVVQLGSDGRLAEANSQKNDGLAVIDITGDDERLVKRIQLPDEPCSKNIAVTADSRRAYIVTRPHPPDTSPRIYEIELEPPFRFDSLAFPKDSSLTSVVLSERQRRLFICDSGQRKIWAVDTSVFPREAPAGYFHLNRRPPSELLLDDPRSLLIALSSEWKTLYFLDARDGRILAQTKGLRDGCGRLTFAADGKSVLLSSGAQRGGVAVVRVPSRDPPVVFASDRGGETFQLYVMNIDGSGVRPFFREPRVATDRMPRWSPNGARIAFLSNERGAWRVCTADRAGSQVRVLDHTEPDIGQPVDWSPDGRLVAFAHKDRRAICVVDVETGEVRNVPASLPKPYNRPQALCWAPDGNILAAVMRSDWGPDCDLFRINPASGETEQLTDELGKAPHCYSPIVSQDGRLACLRLLERDDPRPRLYLAPHDYRARQRLRAADWTLAAEENSRAGQLWARWLPDNSRIIYADLSPDGPYEKLFLVDATLGVTRQLTKGDWNDTQPDVSPTMSEEGSSSRAAPTSRLRRGRTE